MKKKNIIVIIVIGVLVSITIGILVLINTKTFKETLIKKDLRNMANTFYSYYYDENNSDNNISEYLKKYSKSGLGVPLGDLEVYLESRTKTKTINKKLEKCDRAYTRIIIKPYKPYGKNDYELKFELKCN